MFIKVLSTVFALAYLLASCQPSSTVQTESNQSEPVQASMVQKIEGSTSIKAGVAQDNESLAMIFDRITGSNIGAYDDFGFLWMSQNAGHGIWFVNKQAFILARGVIFLPDVKPGDIVYTGSREDVMKQLTGTVEKIEFYMEEGEKPLRVLRLSGVDCGNRLILFTFTEGDDDWMGFINPDKKVPATEIRNMMAEGMIITDIFVDP